MEEADARLQEVVASLLTEHGGNHEQALRQTFACLHNSGLYEAQSPAEEEQREQQVLAVFRSFPFRAPAAPVANGVEARVEEAQAPPPNGTLAREPEEAGEIIPVQADPENVGEDASAQPPPEALLPLNPAETPAEEQQHAIQGPEVSHLGAGAPLNPPQPPLGEGSTSHQGAAGPESFAAEDFETGNGTAVVAAAATPAPAAAATAAGAVGGARAATAEGLEVAGGTEESKGGEWGQEEWGAAGQGGFPETGEAGAGVFVEERAGGAMEETGQHQQHSAERQGGESGGMSGGLGVGGGLLGNGSVAGGGGGGAAGDPESTRQEHPLGDECQSSGHPAPRQEVESAARYPQLNGGRVDPPQATLEDTVAAAAESDSSSAPYLSAVTPPLSNGTTAAPAASSTAPAANAAGVKGSAAGASVAGAAAAVAPTTAGVVEPHLKTTGQFVNHANRAESPTGMSTDLQDKLKALKLRRKHRFLVMRIDGTEVVADVVGAPAQGPADLRAALPYSDCRYAVYDQELVTSDGRKTSKLFFFTWLPHNATPHNKVVYSHGKMTVRQRLQGLYDVAASSFADVEVALGLAEEEDEDSDIDF